MGIFGVMTTQTTHYAGFPEFGPGDRIRLLRRKVLKMTQPELAEALHIGGRALSAWEAGRNQAGISPAIAKRMELLTGKPGTAAFVLGVLPDPFDGQGLPRLDSNQKPPGYRSLALVAHAA